MNAKRSWHVPSGDEVVPGRRVEAHLGGGARTEVYRCTDHDTGGPVVVKVLRPGRTGASDVRMLRRESRTLQALDHPGFPRLVDADLDADPAWIVMTHVDGPHLSDLLDARGPLDGSHAVPLARDVAEALAHLHARGRVHLDVKPSNIVMGARPVLLDLGASRRIERAARLRPGVGTQVWLSPEQAEPATFGGPGPPADVWGLGMVLLKATTGDNPLTARRRPHPPDEATLAEHCRDRTANVPPPLSGPVRACLSTTPADRPTARDLIAWLDGAITPDTGAVGRLAALLRGRRRGQDS